MKKTVITFTILAALVLSLTGCGDSRTPASEAPAQPPVTADAPAPAEDEPAAETHRENGERFEAVIAVEGMEETVPYEHVVNETAGFEMDYEYESFTRHSEADRERFISVWDDPENPENYLEVTGSPEDAETVAASVSEELSQTYDLLKESYELARGGSCTRIEASEIKGTGRMSDQLQVVYIIPAPDGCRVAAAHFSIEGAEGFGRRFFYMVNTLSVIERDGKGRLSDEQALSWIRNYCYAAYPNLEGMVNAGEYRISWEIVSSDEQEIVVMFRSYTGAEVRYYIDRTTGDAYSTEFVPGITPEEQRTEEIINVWEYR